MDLAQLSAEQRTALADEIDRELATRDFLTFCRRVMPHFETPPHVVKTAEKFQRITDGISNRCFVAQPPRTGKSTLATLYVAFYLGQHPDRTNMIVTYGDDLSERHSRAIRDIVMHESWPFRDVTIRKDSAAVGAWTTVQGGGVIAVGAGSAITGRSASGVLLCDDLIKNELDVDSTDKQQKFREWFSGTLFTRLEKTSAIISIGTRWSLIDAQSIILEAGGEWDSLVLPMVSTGEADALGRSEGGLLWPERFPQEMIDHLKQTLTDKQWRALYCSDPVPSEGTIFLAEHLQERYDEVPLRTIYKPAPRGDIFSLPGTMKAHKVKPIAIVSADAAWALNTSSDYQALCAIFYDYERFFVDYVWRDRVPYTTFAHKIAEVYRQYQPRMLVVEKAASGLAITDILQHQMHIPVIGVNSRGNKQQRAEAVTLFFEQRKVLFKAGQAWLPMTMAELTQFPGAPHDDVVDCIVQAMLSIMEGFKVQFGEPGRMRNLMSFGQA